MGSTDAIRRDSTESWAEVDAELERAVTAAGFGGCSMKKWSPDQRSGEGSAWSMLTEPFIVPVVTSSSSSSSPSSSSSSSSSSWASASHARLWTRPAFLAAHGTATVRVRLPAGQRQSGLLSRETTIAAFAAELASGGSVAGRGVGIEPGLLLDRAPASLVAAADGLLAPDALVAGANLTAAVISLGGAGVGLPFHNHGVCHCLAPSHTHTHTHTARDQP